MSYVFGGCISDELGLAATSVKERLLNAVLHKVRHPEPKPVISRLKKFV